MNKSLSATHIAKMVFCEASVKQKAILSSSDLLRMEKGKVEHLRFEHEVQSQVTNQYIKEIESNNIKVISNEQAIQQNVKVSPLRNITMTAIVIVCVVISYFLNK